MLHHYHFRLSALLLTASLAPACLAQNWVAGEPVNLHVSTVSVSAWASCFPNADGTFSFPPSEATGVQHIAIVTEATPAGSINVLPDITGAEIGDTLYINNSNQHPVYFTEGFGLITFEFYAVGTPTDPGDPHLCAFNDLWMSDLGICPEGLGFPASFTCVVEAASGVVDHAANPALLQLPTSANGWVLSTTGNAPALLIDATGRTIATGTRIDTAGLADGLYTVTSTQADGAREALTFTLLRN